MIRKESDDQSVGFPFSWEHVEEFIVAKHGVKHFESKKMKLKGQPCDLCQGPTLQLHCKSPAWTWQNLCGRACDIEVCFNCKAWRHYGIIVIS